jgi:hypothetical protein
MCWLKESMLLFQVLSKAFPDMLPHGIGEYHVRHCFLKKHGDFVAVLKVDYYVSLLFIS